jgi:hypothetical protein
MAVCCQNLPLGALSSRNAFSVPVGALFTVFFEHASYAVLFRMMVLTLNQNR